MTPSPTYHRVYKNSFILTFLRVIEPALAMVVIVAVSRKMGAEAMGGYSFIITFVSMFSVIGQMGLQALLTREVAANKGKSSSYLTAALLLGLCSSVILGFAMQGAKAFFGLSPEVARAIWLMGLNLFPLFAVATFEAVFMGWERSDLILFEQIAGNLLRVVLSLVFIHLGLGLVALVGAIVASTALSVGICAVTYARHLGAPSLRIDPRGSLGLLRASPTFLLITLVTMLSARLDILILTKLTDMTQVALYAAAYKLFEAAMIVPQCYMRASFPHLSALFRSRPDAFGQTNRDMLRHTLLYVFPVAAVMVALAPFLTGLLYGAKFASSATILRILMIGLIPWTMGRTIANIMVATHLQRYDLLSGVVTVVSNVLLNLWMIPRFGAVGAALSSAASLSAFFLCELYFARRAGYTVPVLEAARIPMAAGAALLAALWVAGLGWLYAFIEWGLLAAAAGFYCKSSRNRRKLIRPFTVLQEIMRA
jgi:O-antigen/teichoic acid export membrane protein